MIMNPFEETMIPGRARSFDQPWLESLLAGRAVSADLERLPWPSST